MSENNLPAVQAEKSMAISETLVPRNLIEVKELATFLAASDLIPSLWEAGKKTWPWFCLWATR